jgi:hypothetical protein
MAIKYVLVCLAVLLGIAFVAADNPFKAPFEAPLGAPVDSEPWGEMIDELYPFEISEEEGVLIDEDYSNQYSKARVPSNASQNTSNASQNMSNASQNIFWIMSQNGDIRIWSVDMPLNSYARALIIPAASGELLLEESDPLGQAQEDDLGLVTAGRQYRIWLFADSTGTHTSRYRINNSQYSDNLTYRVT